MTVMNLKEIQKETGAAADGIFGPKTAAALHAAGYEVVLDAGHTGDRAREYPSVWPASAWQNAAWCEAAAALGYDKTTKDSVEHILNLAIATACRKELERRGVKVLLYDDHTMENAAEYKLAAKVANAAAPRAFVSLHNNGSKGVDGYLTNTASGTISFYRTGRENGRELALALTTALLTLRAATGGPNNRADKAAATAAYHVLNATAAAIPAALVEVGFYDNLKDLCWMVKHLDRIGAALADGITKFLKGAA